MAGRKPKPTALKKLECNPRKRKMNTKEPMPKKGMPECPKWLLPEAKEEWKRLCQKLSEMGVLTEIDMADWAVKFIENLCLKCRALHFRHTFAVHVLQKWITEGADLTAMMPILSTYMGHMGIRSTAQYLRLTAEVYPDLMKQVEKT